VQYRYVVPASDSSSSGMYGIAMDPLAPEDTPHLLMTCYMSHTLLRLNVKTGAVTIVFGSTFEGGESDGNAETAQLNAPNGLALAPRELLRDNDALALVLCDMTGGRVRIVRVPH
jgi:hypothetical protein